MKAEFEKIFSLFEEFEEAGQAVTLTFASRGGKSTVKLQLESSTSSSSSSPAQPSPPVPGQRRRHRGPRAKARRNQRAAAHQASLAEAATSVPLGDPHSPRPLCPLQSPSPSSGRRRVTSLGCQPFPSFSHLNLDGPPPSPPPQPHQSPLPSATSVPSSSPSLDTYCPNCDEDPDMLSCSLAPWLSSEICPSCSQPFHYLFMY